MQAVLSERKSQYAIICKGRCCTIYSQLLYQLTIEFDFVAKTWDGTKTELEFERSKECSHRLRCPRWGPNFLALPELP